MPTQESTPDGTQTIGERESILGQIAEIAHGVVHAYLNEKKRCLDEYCSRLSLQRLSSLEGVSWVEGELLSKRRSVGTINTLVHQCTVRVVRSIVESLFKEGE